MFSAARMDTNHLRRRLTFYIESLKITFSSLGQNYEKIAAESLVLRFSSVTAALLLVTAS